ncbi:hypothetical protein EYF80_066992 [Liparis tanakae]|uniref:Uncharacterized protein n=1 Tax=Liparis tanakae TaxID=230148 RepID=A0A4Z2E3E5_9TELE|nr:hypothetical protein EYF80_066992 [Liparis tanakae]
MSLCFVFILFNPSPAVRAATLGSWRRLSLGAEYEDTWTPSPGQRGRPLEMHVEEEEEEEEEEEGAGLVGDAGDPEEGPSWRLDTDGVQQKYDSVLRLDGLSRTGRRDGLRRLSDVKTQPSTIIPAERSQW